MAIYKGDDVNTDKKGLAANIKKCKNDTNPAKMVVNGTIKGATIAGKIDSSEDGGSIVVNSNCKITTHEPKDGKDHKVYIKMYWFNIDLTLNMRNSSGSYVNQTIAKTYVSKNGDGFYYFE